jgi:hypothetical protein
MKFSIAQKGKPRATKRLLGFGGRDLPIEMGQSMFQYLAVSRVGGAAELLENALAGELEAF